ncbi:50S ribosomal protein L23 [Candidatus Gracilibacteria bacterium]|jgi:large subunit ribosomal protein L23|nr:50S ribosomal protein L23 [Candidatus Gracilibacteria bacterium]
MRLYTILQKPIVTEKTSNQNLGGQSRYAFEIAPSATKIDVKKAIKELYGVDVASVNILNTREKFKFGKKRTMQLRKRSAKKAYVTLKNAKDVIDVTILK